jgi:Kef-type K+ transport system membrane component KefB
MPSETIAKGKLAGKKYGSLIVLGLAILLFFSVLRASLFGDVPEEKRIWFELSFLLLAAIGAELLVVHFKQPSVILLLAVGALIGPSAVSIIYPLLSGAVSFLLLLAGIAFSPLPQTAPHLVPTEGTVRVFAQLGSIILLLKIGLHSEIRQIFNFRNFAVALAGVVVPFAAGYAYAAWTGHAFGYAMFLGAALTATSVGVTVAVLQEFKLLEKEFAKIILGAAVIDDVLALLVLSLVENVPSEISAAALAPLAATVGTAAVFLIGAVLAGKTVVAQIDRLGKGGSDNTVFLGALAYVLAYAYVAETIGLSAIVGAFIAGITLNFSRFTEKLFGLFYPLEAFFTPIFFISLGMLVNIPALFENAVPIIAITVIAIATKIAGCSIAASLAGAGKKDAWLVGLGMVPRGEIALIIGLFGLTAKTASGEPVLQESEYAIIASMAFLTTIVAPVLLQKALGQKTQPA